MQCGGGVEISRQRRLRHGLRLHGGDVGQNRNDALPAQRHYRHCLIVIAAPDGEIRTGGAELPDFGDAGRCFLDPRKVGDAGQPAVDLHGNINAGTGGNVVGDDRDMYRSGDGAVVGEQTLRRGLVVVGGDHEQRVRSRALRCPAQRRRVFRAV